MDFGINTAFFTWIPDLAQFFLHGFVLHGTYPRVKKNLSVVELLYI